MIDISLEDVLNAYCNGIFPMAESAEDGPDNIGWYSPPERGVIPLDDFNIPRSLKKDIRARKHEFYIAVDEDFPAVIEGCAATSKGRSETWINQTIKDWFMQLHLVGLAHSIEFRRTADDELMGGLYGLAIGAAFFGESMFSRTSGASKIALVALVAYMKNKGYTLLDTQFVNDHLTQFGCHAIAKDDYLEKLHNAIRTPIEFGAGLQTHPKGPNFGQIIPQSLILESLR